MEKSIVINVDPEEVKDYHRGDVCDIDFGYDGKVERHKVRIVSKYRLRNGESRVKLVSFQQSVYPTLLPCGHTKESSWNELRGVCVACEVTQRG
jgi:hypothetical protein